MTTTATEWLAANIDAMLEAPAHGLGMDIVIVSTSSTAQAAYWQRRLEATRGEVAATAATVLAVHEDWPGGAGNGLGTLYAIQQAAILARERYGLDLMGRLHHGAAIALYHTAGKGTRLAPLPGSEANNKPGVKLPGLVHIDGQATPITILEAVIRQTAIYAPSRGGRISVFWGDQIFIPSCDPAYTPRHHADILCRLAPMPSAADWAARGLHKYGLIAVDAAGDARQVEKIDHATASALIAGGKLAVDGGIGVSLGSFSMSGALTEALLLNFRQELERRETKLDTDPHFWMPLTLDLATYRDMMAAKGADPDIATGHYHRMQTIGRELRDADAACGLFGAVDIGEEAAWWDYGQLAHYQRCNLRLLDSDPEAAAMRRFFGIAERQADSRFGLALDADRASILIGCRIGGGRVRRSVLVGVTASAVDLDGSVAIACAAPAIAGRGVLYYNVASAEPLSLAPGQVRADAFLPPDDQLCLHSHVERHGGDDWHQTLPGNPCSYADLHGRNQAVDPQAAEGLAADRRRQAHDP